MEPRWPQCLGAIQRPRKSLPRASSAVWTGASHDEQTRWQLGMGAVGRRTHCRRCRWTLAERKEPGQCQAEAEIRRDARKAPQAQGALGVASSSTGRKGSAMVAHKFNTGEPANTISTHY